MAEAENAYEHQDKRQHLVDIEQMIADLETKGSNHPTDIETLRMLHAKHDQIESELSGTVH